MTDGWTSTGALLWRMIADTLHGYVSQREKLFEHHIEPLQEKVMAIHKDYIKGFEEIRRYLLHGTTPPIQFVEYLRERRRDHECERQLSRHLGRAIRKHRKVGITDNAWRAVEAYCRSIVRYFEAGSNLGDMSWYSHFLDVMQHHIDKKVDDVWERMPIAPDPRKSMLEEVDRVLQSLPRSFERVVERYTDLRVLLY